MLVKPARRLAEGALPLCALQETTAARTCIFPVLVGMPRTGASRCRTASMVLEMMRFSDRRSLTASRSFGFRPCKRGRMPQWERAPASSDPFLGWIHGALQAHSKPEHSYPLTVPSPSPIPSVPHTSPCPLSPPFLPPSSLLPPHCPSAPLSPHPLLVQLDVILQVHSVRLQPLAAVPHEQLQRLVLVHLVEDHILLKRHLRGGGKQAKGERGDSREKVGAPRRRKGGAAKRLGEIPA
jgi:hypothetical protein